MIDRENIRSLALGIGFDACGFASAEPLDDDNAFLQDWLSRGFHASMDYMTTPRHKPQSILASAKTAIVCLLNYFPSVEQDCNQPQIARYAYSTDYHYIMWNKLHELASAINAEEYAVTCDSMPLLERALAVRAGLGWIGRNNLLINPRFGSFTFIGVLLVPSAITPDSPMPNRCGNCRKCLDNCPTHALADHSLNSNLCLSFLTIESKNPLEPRLAVHNRLFGCDLCQLVCPWNKRFAHAHNHPELAPVTLDIDLNSVSRAHLTKIHSPLSRASLSKIRQNINLIKTNSTNTNP